MTKLILRAEVTTASQLKQALSSPDIDLIYAPDELISNGMDVSRIIAVPPVFLGGEENEIAERLSAVKKLGVTGAMAHTLGHIGLIKSLKMDVYGGSRLNITNSDAMTEYEKLGLTDSLLSFELTVKRAASIAHTIPIGMIAYGRLPLMITRRCPISDGKTCNTGVCCGKGIVDRRGTRLPVICRNCAEILNPDVLILSDRLNEFSFSDFLLLRFTDEESIEEIINMYKTGGKPDGKLTRGLYYRGVE